MQENSESILFFNRKRLNLEPFITSHGKLLLEQFEYSSIKFKYA